LRQIVTYASIHRIQLIRYNEDLVNRGGRAGLTGVAPTALSGMGRVEACKYFRGVRRRE
jgi:hypothetical protein